MTKIIRSLCGEYKITAVVLTMVQGQPEHVIENSIRIFIGHQDKALTEAMRRVIVCLDNQTNTSH